MSSLGAIISDIQKQNFNPKHTSYIKIKQDSTVSKISPYVSGGISGLKKDPFIKLLKTLQTYNPQIYSIDNKIISPDLEQSSIITAPSNHNIRILAGAGTGKTTTIVCRIKYLLSNFTTPDKILVLTFNVDAKDNLIKQIKRLFGFDIKIEIRTIDSFCHGI